MKKQQYQRSMIRSVLNLAISGLIILSCLSMIWLGACASTGSSQTGIQKAPEKSPGSDTAGYGHAVSADLVFQSQETIKGKIEEDPEQILSILLPPSYEKQGDRHYPVIYYLHGYGDPANELEQAAREILEEAWAAGDCPEFILVSIPGTNALGGSFYVDSPVTGNWQSMIVNEVVPLIDRTYRTYPSSDARMIAGFSMGGFGAWNLALSQPGSFAWAWACCPGALAPGEIETALVQWDIGFQIAYGSAFAPEPGQQEEPYAAMPGNDDEAQEKAVLDRWQAGFGDIEGKLAAYGKKGKAVKAIRFDYGANDWYAWIPRGTQYTAQVMEKSGLPVEIKDWPAGHEIHASMIIHGLVPFVQKSFATAR